ncbi:hypothetical protein EB093_08010, partial [bacterium]|nr:hypothetical protein [bacterium]
MLPYFFYKKMGLKIRYFFVSKFLKYGNQKVSKNMPKKYPIILNETESETTNNSINDTTREKIFSQVETKKYQMETKKYQRFFCEKCKYSTTINSNYEKHKNTKKHLDNVGADHIQGTYGSLGRTLP